MLQSQSIKIDNINALPDAAQQLIVFAGADRVIIFNGDLGAGKTTFIKEVCKELGVEEIVSSPTFSLVNQYDADHSVVYHFDFYRLKNEMEALDMGYEEYFYSGNYCFVEWPSKIPNLLPENYTEVVITEMENGARELSFIKHTI
ncbi:tRNA (adenosine(37)-N6)-threonylcarbamoyltransferase complex ATPase subunit type 1 TsaE [Solitalea lacus]|uniref:tRNA (adenosine(37)-N6)-threonylcarbamoyltransferase complex ATPase subunit type 1 TsaE n=1 Tax=Solitalea lacus TaxID=2911172 RepID=UPI001EDC929C|nr:tRNA (adenosine(37)-N6)-threonylcarbamoyltransferase complex ATPase subunit type 1 TsaE [Solitalea lacus]UKJ08028.1 tRNA (adenosine(37)-N6)-threonylcarbamoyltransferase complex ATPase subunit type 1 TsaE [Solitalea lacus]